MQANGYTHCKVDAPLSHLEDCPSAKGGCQFCYVPHPGSGSTEAYKWKPVAASPCLTGGTAPGCVWQQEGQELTAKASGER